jgi:hypothetical protein
MKGSGSHCPSLRYFIVYTLSNRIWKHILKYIFQCHGVTATPTTLEEIAITTPLAAIHMDGVWIILTVKSDPQRLDMNAIALLGIPFGFLDLPDHAVIHKV